MTCKKKFLTMDVSASAENTKRQKLVEGQSDIESQDIISNLPENILEYILSFIPTKDVVASSVLSTNWRYLWTSVHNLDFSDGVVYPGISSESYVRRNKGFTKFVDKVLHHNSVPNIEKFSLSWFDYDEAHFREWISFAIGRKVQELNLSLYVDQASYIFPFCLLLFESLNTLKLKSAKDFTKVPLIISSSICFSSLKALHLQRVAFFCEKSMQEVSLTFPVLEDFLMEDFRWWAMKCVNIFTPALQVLTIKETWDDFPLHDSMIKISADSITSLKLRSVHLYKYSIYNLSRLDIASIDLRLDIAPIGFTGEDFTVHRLGLVLRQISNVKDLELSTDCIETLCRQDIQGHLFPFSRLTRLNLVGNGRNNSVSGRKLVEFLCGAPNIEVLHFPYGLNTLKLKGRSRQIGQTPQCFLSHLKLLNLSVFYGKDDEFWFLKFLVKSVSVTDKVTIKVENFGYLAGWSREVRAEKIIKQLQVLASDPKCVVEYSSEDP